MADLTYTGLAADGNPSNANNWDPIQSPADGDNLYLRHVTVDISTYLDSQDTIIFNRIEIEQSALGNFGTADEYWQIGYRKLIIGPHDGPGSPAGAGRIKIHQVAISGACEIRIENTASSSSDTNRPPVQLLTDNPGTTFQIRKGSAGIAIAPTETSDVDTIEIGYVNNVDTDADLQIGPGVTYNSLDKRGGTCVHRGTASDLTNRAGELITEGSSAISHLICSGGSVIPNATGTVTLADADGGTIDTTRSRAQRTFTTVNRRGTGQFIYDSADVSIGTLDTGGPASLGSA